MSRDKILWLFLIFIGTLVSCNKDQTSFSLSSYHFSYYPIQKDSYCIYDVVEIIHDQNALNEHDTLFYQLKTLIGDTLVDDEGRIANKFFRYKRNTIFDPWILTDVWTTILDENRAEIVEENIRRVALRFPVSVTTIWDPNQFNFLTPSEAFYTQIHEPRTMNGIQMDSTVKVVAKNDLSLISYQNQFEIYAKGIGLVQKFYKDVKITNFDTLNVQSGIELYYNLISYGH